VNGGEGNDRIFTERGNDSANGGPGTDYIDGGLGDDWLEGGKGDGDVVIGNHGSDSASGGGGNGDVVRGGIGFDRLDGGPGTDDIASFSEAPESVTVDLEGGSAKGDGRDTLTGFEDVIGSASPDRIEGDGGPNRLDGGAGYDTLDGRGGDDQLFGGPDGAECEQGAVDWSCGEEEKTVGEMPTVVRTASIDGTATLTVRGSSFADEIWVSYGDSSYTVSSSIPFPDGNVEGCDSAGGAQVRCPDGVQSILITTDGGNDTVVVDPSVPPDVQVRIDGGSGADSLYGGTGADVIEAGNDNDPDLLVGGPGGDALIGARGDLSTPYESGTSTLIGGEGSDLLVGGDPCDGDLFDGGPGNDTATFIRFNPGVTAQIGGPATRAGESCTASSILPSVEALEGSEGPDTLIGDNRANTLSGRGGDDTLAGQGGNDRLVGGGGADHLFGGTGRDSEHQ
jgi:Ca2+-binding RTX toxin-like protein